MTQLKNTLVGFKHRQDGEEWISKEEDGAMALTQTEQQYEKK